MAICRRPEMVAFRPPARGPRGGRFSATQHGVPRWQHIFRPPARRSELTIFRPQCAAPPDRRFSAASAALREW
eukprot:1474266-Pyramimonas_sp.AAC.1